MTSSRTRDVGLTYEAPRLRTGGGKQYVAVIGIDRYRDHNWERLNNAVRDARGVLAAFERLGFEKLGALFDEAATGEAINRLAIDGLDPLGPEDSVVLFFAGHGYTDSRELASGKRIKRGYIIPSDADGPGRRVSSWVNLDSWLGVVVDHRPKHILIILDSCHSGIAIQLKHYRGADIQPFEKLRVRTSRRVLTSSLDEERAMDDGGPYDGHSLFTGCLLEALDGGLVTRTGRRQVTALELCSYVQHRVGELSNAKQTPVTGHLPPDDQGQLILDLPEPLSISALPPEPVPVPVSGSKHGAAGVNTGAHTQRVAGGKTGSKSGQGKGPKAGATPKGRVSRPDGSLLDVAFVAALDRQDAIRLQGGNVLSIVSGDSTATLADWAAWAAGRGYLTLVTQGASPDAAVRDLLAHIPWLRCLPEARRLLAKATGLEVEAVDATLDARSGDERSRWIDDVAGLDQRVRVSGWLLSALRERASVPELSTAPVQGAALLAILCELATPIAVLVHHAEPSVPWLERAIETAAALLRHLPGRPIAVGAPREIVNRVLGGNRQSTALAMARQGMIPVATRTGRTPTRSPGQRAKVLHDALEQDPRMRRVFELGVQVRALDGGADIDVDLMAHATRLAVVIDGWYHHSDPQGHQRECDEDARLRRAGYFVLRFPAEDIDQRLALVVAEIAIVHAGRHIAGDFSGESHDKHS